MLPTSVVQWIMIVALIAAAVMFSPLLVVLLANRRDSDGVGPTPR